ncbi:MAG TPA: efflux transporter outer membrane subunit [Candidatus Methylomirabilis sp.]|nr:efflux transporter outer membrane subunit [Candidatus Methylomirabilis sp.]
MRRALVGVAVGLAVAGCTVGPNYQRPESTAPAEFRGLGPENPPGPASLAELPWWEVFGDPVLHDLIREALRQNYDLRIAAERILEARAQVTIARSFQFPEVNGGGTAQYTNVQGSLQQPPQFGEAFAPAVGFDVSFEIDFWGRFRRATEAARADLLSSEAARRVVVIGLVSDVATGYFSLRELDKELEISRNTLASRLESLRLVNLRAQGGVAADIDVRQAEVLVAQAAQVVPDTERLIAQTENALSVLLGHNPEAMPRGRVLVEQITLPALPAGFPSTLLERRPDIIQVDAQLAAATARIGVAKSDYFPRVFLSGSAAGGGIWIDGNWAGPQGLFAIGPSFTIPIFNTGRTGAGVASAEARAQAALDQYRQTVIQAFREVSDSLVEYQKRKEFRVQQEALATAARDAVRLANIRYTGGVTSFLEVQDTERQSFDADLGLVRSYRDELLAVVRLYKSLGGGWQEG